MLLEMYKYKKVEKLVVSQLFLYNAYTYFIIYDIIKKKLYTSSSYEKKINAYSFRFYNNNNYSRRIIIYWNKNEY